MFDERKSAPARAYGQKQTDTNPPPSVIIDSNQLLMGAKAIDIEHAGQRYVLRVTRENKLILTK